LDLRSQKPKRSRLESRAPGVVAGPDRRRDEVCALPGASARRRRPDTGRDNPTLIPALAAPIESGAADFVLGTRTRGTRNQGSVSVLQIAAGRFAGFGLRILYGVKIHRRPFRTVRMESLDRLAMMERNYGRNLR